VSENSSPGSLSGMRVLELTRGIVGAIAAMILADAGAEVIKVVPSGTSSPGLTRTWDRGKSSLALDLQSPDDRRVLLGLAERADVVITAVRPGTADRLGLTYEALRAANPAVVLTQITGFGPDDDSFPGYDALAAARYGVMAESPGHRDGPVFPGHPAISYSTALLAVISTLAAVRARLVTGEGEFAQVSLRDGVLGQMGMNWSSDRGLSFIAARSRTGALDMGKRRMLLRLFECSDGELVQVHTGAAGAFARAMKLFGLDDEITPGEGLVETASDLSDRDLEILRDRLPALFRTRTAAEWQELCWAHEVACLPVQPPGRVFSDDQIRHAGIMATVDDPELGPILTVGPVIIMSDSPCRVAGPIRAPGADGERLRRDGWSSPGLGSTPEPRTISSPLDGIRILEFSNWFASPYGNRLLGDLGADVVKVEPLSGDLIRPLPDPCEGANRGKRSVALDLKRPETADVLQRLVSTADVVQHNMRPGAAERLGLDYETLGVRSDLLYAYAPGYGATGPKAPLQSFAPLLSGFVGLMHMAAGPGNEPHASFGNEDYYNGLLSAAGILLGLVHRERTGRGQYIETPQLHSSVLVTSEWFEQGGQLRSSLPSLDADQLGWAPWYRVYQCLTGWLCVACGSPEQVEALVNEVLPGGSPEDQELGEALAYEFTGLPAEDWWTRLRKAGVPSEAVRETSWLKEFLRDDTMVTAGRVNQIDHPVHGPARVIGLLFHLRNHPGLRRGRSPLLGEHTIDVLSDIGFDDERVRHLTAAGVIR
jgi:crotonobetainyl-CoA:carnitine CoA-transferase CaiB-like acyl-CoA transferase